MKGLLIAIGAAAFTSPALANDVAASLENGAVPVAFAELAAGQTRAAVDRLESDRRIAPNDPSRLINLATAYARMGQSQKAARLYRAAMRSGIRYDVELASGDVLDSREAAKRGLASLNVIYASR